MYVIVPILLFPQERVIDEEDINIISGLRRVVDDWFESRGVPGLLIHTTRPLAPPCGEPLDYFEPDSPPRTLYKVHKWLLENDQHAHIAAQVYGVEAKDIIYLVFLKGFHGAHGHGGGALAVVDWDVVENLKEGISGGLPEEGLLALAIICHELGHCLGGEGHSDDQDIMNVSALPQFPFLSVPLSWMTKWRRQPDIQEIPNDISND